MIKRGDMVLFPSEQQIPEGHLEVFGDIFGCQN